MNALFVFAGGLDLESNHAKLLEFWRLDKEIATQIETLTYKERFHSLEFALLCARAKNIINQLTK